MNKHEVTVINEERYCINYNIDGQLVSLNRTGATIDLTDTTAIANIISCIENSLQNDGALIPFTEKLNGKNLFRILDACFHDLAVENWIRFFSSYCDHEAKAFKKAFVCHYGFYHSSKTEPTSLYNHIRAFSEERKHYTEPKEAFTQQYSIIRKEIIGNVAFYEINGNDVELCLRVNPELKHAKTVLSLIIDAEQALIAQNYDRIVQSISEVGGKAYLQLAQLFFDKSLRNYLKGFAKAIVEKERKRLYPDKIIKHFFGTQLSDYYTSLINELEEIVPWMVSFLVETNLREIESLKDAWLLYEQEADTIYCYTTSFIGSPDYIKAAQELCRQETKKFIIAEKPYVRHIHSIAHDLSFAFTIFTEIGLPIEKVTDITRIHLGGLLSFLTNNQYSMQTQRRVLYRLHAMYSMFVDEKKSGSRSPFKLFTAPKSELNPTIPLSSEQLMNISSWIQCAPEYIQIAVDLAVSTGARANSICKLTVDDFSFENGNNTVVITLYKTPQKDVTRIIHPIENDLAQRIQRYIIATEELRRQLSCPYLLVYRPIQSRTQTHQVPKVLTANTFAYEMKKCFKETPLYDANGFSLNCAFKVLRATYGRELFLAGVSESEAARRMGNTAKIKASHYTTLFPADYAKLHHELYQHAIIPTLHSSPQSIPVPHQKPVMFGKCGSGNPCNQNDCTTCINLIQKRKK